MKRLLLDQLRREPMSLTGISLSFLIWSNVLDGRWSMSWGPALSLLAVSMAAGPMRLEAQAILKPIALLPLGRRDVWRARWIIGVVFPAVISLAGKAIAVALGASFGDGMRIPAVAETLSLSTLYDGVFACLVVGLSAVNLTRGGVTLTTLFTTFGLPFVLRPWLPLRFSDLGAGWIVALLLATALGLALWSSNITDETPVFEKIRRRRARGGRWLAGPIARFLLPRPGVEIPDAAEPVGASLARIVAARGAGVVILLTFLICIGVFRLFTAGSGHGVGARAALVDWMPFAIVSGCGDWRPTVRRLRRLPLSTWDVNLLVLGTACGQWLVMWLGIAPLVHLLWPTLLPHGLPATVALAMSGLSAAGESARLRWRGWAYWIVVAATIAAVACGAHALSPASDAAFHLAAVIVAGVTLAGAALLNQRTIRHSTELYRRRSAELPFPLGILIPI